ncbi:cellulose biosynthesis cyclic di-GMP-binding regulatory protein BcsB [Polaribacter sargassicola]|uniref:cellulose biosynthesis cyclic di-GMP-binding regulatory protein BcsB n=1 Tax=Polaribacter sargassicola TaxID=2836891 RepID=UPI001F2CD1BF|nr:cellulose biosynthesis cyclic di-GMP-binding regulatory protein BcsB [Polaribacter sp. DS7-9]MCG1036500.1 cellulose biosynthesis cyclic di-GMP-binding regulatory protein BcsB [Polaribacter sp. DS7-9]
MKKYYFIVLTILLGIHVQSFGQVVEHFNEYDYSEEITINGAQGMEEIYIPVKENIDILNSYINLEFICSNVLDFDKSHMSVLIADTPIETRFLKNQDQIISFKIPVKKKYIVSDFIKITLQTNLRIGSEICEADSKSGFWIKLTENSFFSYNLLPSEEKIVKKTISYTIPDIKYIVLSDNSEIKDIEYASYIKFYLKRVYGLDTKIKNIKDYKNSVIEDAIIIMPYDKLSERITTKTPTIEKENVGLVSVFNDQYKDSTSLKTYNGQNIVVTGKSETGFSKAAHYLLQKHLINSSYVDYVFVHEEAKLLDIPQRKDYEPIYFKELGAQNNILQGLGYLQSNVALPRSKFGSNVKKMDVNIEGKYRPLSDNEQGYFNLYFNDIFLTSYKLDNTGDLNISFSFDDIIMQQNNNFKYEFYFVPEGGMCDTAGATFYGQIDAVNSYFKPVGYDVSSSLSFFRFPENFQSKPLTIYTDLDPEQKLISSISELIDIINPGETGLSGFIYPKIKNATLKEIEADLETSKIIISKESEKFSTFFAESAYIKFKNNVVEYDSEEIKPFFNVEYEKELGYNQLFYHNSSPVMLVNVPQEYNANTLLSLISNIREQTIADTGNVIIADNNNAYFFDLRIINDNHDKNYLNSLLDGFWGKYRIFIVSILLILGILVLIFIFQKSKESKAKIQDEK